MNDKLDYFSDLEIDNNNLDKEFDQQHIIFMRYWEIWSKKKDEVNEQRRILKIREAAQKETYNKVYLNYSSFRDEKGKAPTVAVISAQTEVDEKYTKSRDLVFSEIKKLNVLLDQELVLEGVVKSFQQRKNNLESKRDFWILGYTGSIKSRDSKEKITDSIHQKLNRGCKNE